MSEKVAYRLIVLFTVVSAIVFAVFAVIWLVNPAALVPAGVDGQSLFARFAGGRNLAIDVVILLLVFLKKKEALGYFLLAMALIQTYDAALGLYIGQPGSAIAPILNAAVYFLCSWYLLRRIVRKRERADVLAPAS